MTQMHWIDANEQVPPDEKPVLCHYGFDHGYGINPMTFIGVLSYFAFDPTPHWQHASHDLVVTHWMPLPEKPSINVRRNHYGKSRETEHDPEAGDHPGGGEVNETSGDFGGS